METLAPSGQPVPARRPVRVRVAAVLVGLLILVLAGMLLDALWLLAMPVLGVDAGSILGLALMVAGLGWVAFLLHALLVARPWVRLAVSVTLPLFVPLFVLGVWQETRLLAFLLGYPYENHDIATTSVGVLLLIVLLLAGIPLAAVPPLLLIGPDVAAHLGQRRNPETPSAPATAQDQ